MYSCTSEDTFAGVSFDGLHQAIEFLSNFILGQVVDVHGIALAIRVFATAVAIVLALFATQVLNPKSSGRSSTKKPKKLRQAQKAHEGESTEFHDVLRFEDQDLSPYLMRESQLGSEKQT
ncbi:hypothetical protein CCR75_004939 [Bremia lactucae]|uniref:Uncharacterized protein n=1 Tax=Bremia lactucae TaxID=4779 RepID=A0A976FJD8_BRELC|nr:hypothetical protein CCR75_004939 [Bremia lactucae]